MEYCSLGTMCQKELLLKKRWLYEKNPTREAADELRELYQQYGYEFLNPAAPFVSHSLEEHFITPENQYFYGHQHVVIMRHLCYSPMNWHGHEFFELIYVWRGDCIHSINGEEHYLQQGDCCILPPHLMHALYTENETSVIVNILIRKPTFYYTFTSLLSEFDHLSSFFRFALLEGRADSYLMFRCGKDSLLQGTVQQLYEEYFCDEAYSAPILDSSMIVFLGLLLRRHRQDIGLFQSDLEESEVPVSKILAFVSEHLQDISLDMLAQHLHYNKNYLSSLIQKTMGQKFQDIVKEQRFLYAAKMLGQGNQSIKSIMESIGYHDSSHFYRNFKELFGMTPAQYRQTHGNIIESSPSDNEPFKDES